MALICIVVPVYKVEKYIRRCVESILSQTLSDFALILVDDGSPDGCPSICDEYAKQDTRIHVIHQENQGIAAARNAGVSYAADNCSSQWITFVDSDDLIHPQMLELLYDAATKTGADISLCGAIEARDMPIDFYHERYPNVSTRVMNEACILDLYQNGSHRYWTTWAKLVRMEYVQTMPFEVGRIYEDNNLIFKWLCAANKIADLDEVLYFYAINENGISKSTFTLKQLDYLYALKTQICFYADKKYHQLHQILCERYIRDSISMYLKVRDILSDKKAALKLKWSILWFWFKNHAKIHFSLEEVCYRLGILLPLPMNVYWIVQNAKQAYRKEGVAGIISKVVSKLQKVGKK